MSAMSPIEMSKAPIRGMLSEADGTASIIDPIATQISCKQQVMSTRVRLALWCVRFFRIPVIESARKIHNSRLHLTENDRLTKKNEKTQREILYSGQIVITKISYP